MAKRDPERTRKIRVAVRYLLERGCLENGNQSRLAEHFHVSRQRVHQIVVEERRSLMLDGHGAAHVAPQPFTIAHHAAGALSPLAGA